MNKWKNNEEGFTLVELLASIALLSVVILLVGSVHIFGQTQFINQTESAAQSNDLRYSLTVMSRDVRRAEIVTVDGTTLTADGITYTLGNSTLRRNDEVLSNRVGDFAPEMLSDGVQIKIASTTNRQNLSKEYETSIYFRR